MAGRQVTRVPGDAQRLALDPAVGYVVGSRARDRQAASTSAMSRFETSVLIQYTGSVRGDRKALRHGG